MNETEQNSWQGTQNAKLIPEYISLVQVRPDLIHSVVHNRPATLSSKMRGHALMRLMDELHLKNTLVQATNRN